MEYTDDELRQKISEAVLSALSKSPSTTAEIIDLLFVKLKPIVKDSKIAYTLSELREMLSL